VPVDEELGAERPGVAVEAVLPQAVAQDDGGGEASVLGTEQTAEGGPGAEGVEEPGAHGGEQPHQPVRALHGQGAEQHGVHQAEDRGVGTDPERQHGQRQDRRARPVHQAAHGLPQVVKQRHAYSPMTLTSTRLGRRPSNSP
jgi:hypothetical protein